MLCALAACSSVQPRTTAAESAAAPPVGPRVTMAELHAAGGVPQGWRFTPPAGDSVAGRQAFSDFGCYSCHAVKGETFPATSKARTEVGPELTGMGSHHPAEYFAESILNPNAVLVDGPGYIGADGRSVMPAYMDMTLRQLADLVAYLQSLTAGGGAHIHAHRPGSRPSEMGASTFFVQAYAVQPEQLDGFYDWFEREQFHKYPGLMTVQTYIGRRRDDLLVVAVFGFETEASMGGFVRDLDASAGKGRPDFLHPVQRYLLRSPTLYKASGLWVP